MSETTLQKGDYGFTLTFNVQDINGDIFPLTNVNSATLTLTRISDSVKIISAQSMTISDSDNGVLTYAVASGDLREVGEYKVKAKLIYTSGQRTAEFPNIIIEDNP